MILPGFAAQCLHAMLMLLAAPTAVGLLAWAEGRLAGHAGAPWYAPWQELVRLRRKQPVLAESASLVSDLAPPVCFAALAVAALLVPSFALGMSFAPLADLLVLAGLLGLARVVLALASLDDGTASGGIAARQAMTLALGGELALLLVVLALGLAAGTTNLDLIAASTQAGLLQPPAAIALLTGALAVLALVQHDAGMPEAAGFSGSGLALLRMAEGLRLLVWIDLIGAVFVPASMTPAQDFPVGWILGLLGWALRLAVGLGALAGLRAMSGRIAWRRVPMLLLVSLLLAALAGVLVLTRARPV